LSEQAF